jgi:beta-lactamase class A
MTTTSRRSGTLTAIESELESAGVVGFLHARDLATGAEFGHRADEPVVLASVFKIAVALELARQFDAGQLDPTERVVVGAAGRTLGPTGVSALQDEVVISLRDLAQLMITVSDNTATDLLIARVGMASIQRTLRRLGLERTVLELDCRTLLSRLAADLGLSAEEMERLSQLGESPLADLPAERWSGCRDLRAESTNHSTPRETTHLLQLVWRDEAASPDACAFVRRIMGQQVWPHRLRAGFPAEVRVSGKTGSLPFIRNEVGVVEYPDGGRYAVAVFTVAADSSPEQPDADRVIGTVARMMVEALRSSGQGGVE